MKYGVIVRLPKELVHNSYLPTHSLCGFVMDELGIPENVRHYIEVLIYEDFITENILFKFRVNDMAGIPSFEEIEEGKEYPIRSINIDKISNYRIHSNENKGGQTSCSA